MMFQQLQNYGSALIQINDFSLLANAYPTPLSISFLCLLQPLPNFNIQFYFFKVRHRKGKLGTVCYMRQKYWKTNPYSIQ